MYSTRTWHRFAQLDNVRQFSKTLSACLPATNWKYLLTVVVKYNTYGCITCSTAWANEGRNVAQPQQTARGARDAGPRVLIVAEVGSVPSIPVSRPLYSPGERIFFSQGCSDCLAVLLPTPRSKAHDSIQISRYDDYVAVPYSQTQ